MFYRAPLAVCVFTVRYVHVWKSQEGSMYVYRVLMSWVIDLGPHKVGDHLTRNKLLSFTIAVNHDDSAAVSCHWTMT